MNWAAAALASLFLLGHVPLGAEGNEVDARAQAVFDRTKTSRATYSLYQWNWVRIPDGSFHEQWSAEFNDGSRHRVETPQMRAVADCAQGSGTVLNMVTGGRNTGQSVAQALCGIDSGPSIRRLEWLGRSESRFGPVETIRLVDAVNERLYVVDPEGLLVAGEYFPLDPEGRTCLQSEPIAIARSLPAGDLFSEESLLRSVVEARYRFRPDRAIGDLWQGDRRCR